jgi:hypothetical protein
VVFCGLVPRFGLAGGNVQLDQGVGDVALEVGRRGVDEDHVAGQVQQRGRAIEDALGDLGQRVQQEVHRRVGRIIVEGRAAEQGDPLLRPVRGGELRARLQAAVGNEREQHLFDDIAGEATTLPDDH